MTWMPLKDYQRVAVEQLGNYCTNVRDAVAREAHRPERDAYEQQTGRDYYTTPNFEGVPYVCLRIPTGGGKTLMAAHAIGEIGRKLLGLDRPACLWITPSTTIRDQTLRGLKHVHHPYRKALQESLATDVEVVTLEEAMTTPRCVQSKTALVIVTTIQSYRIRNDRGEELADTRRIYRDNGYLQTAFENLPAWARSMLAHDADGNVDLSLANALMMRRPIVIMDEAQNARTPTSFESLARFGPSFVLELTATPQQDHNPDHPSSPTFASNVLHAASALELQKEGMIKLPVDLESRGDWQEVLAATVQRRGELETIADHARETGLPFIRPIALIQAQPSSKTKETQTVEKVKAALIAMPDVDEEQVKICTGSIDEIGDEDLMSEQCQIRYVITVDKLREGWDCPFAYVLGSIGNASTPTAVEQLIGRVLRMPFANPTRVPALDRAYAFVLSDDVVRTAMTLRDRMVQTCGFDDRSAADALRVTASRSQRGLGFGRIPLAQPIPRESLPPTLAGRSRYEEETNTLVLDDLPTQGEIRALRDAAASEEDRAAIDDFWERERPVGIAVKRLDEYAAPLFVPRLTVEQDGHWILLEPEELDTFAWDLERCAWQLSETEFSSEVQVGSAATIQLDESQGGLTTAAAGDVRLKQLELIGEGDDWTRQELTLWLDRELRRGGSFRGLLMSESQPWLARVVSHLADEREVSLPVVVRRRHPLLEILRTMLTDHGRQQTRLATDALIDTREEAIVTSGDHAVALEEQDYAPSQVHDAPHQWQKHAFDLMHVMNDEEEQCALKIDGNANVERWLRNTEHETQGGFWLPKSPGRFFPDYVVELVDGTIILVEYKNKNLARLPEELLKKDVGELWETRSDGKCRFAWVVDKDWATLEAKLAK